MRDTIAVFFFSPSVSASPRLPRKHRVSTGENNHCPIHGDCGIRCMKQYCLGARPAQICPSGHGSTCKIPAPARPAGSCSMIGADRDRQGNRLKRRRPCCLRPRCKSWQFRQSMDLAATTRSCSHHDRLRTFSRHRARACCRVRLEYSHHGPQRRRRVQLAMPGPQAQAPRQRRN